MRILMSIQTRYARKIFAGRKKWEFRKNLPALARESRSAVTTVVYSAGEDRAVIGEFTIGRIASMSFDRLMEFTGTSQDADAVAWLRRYYGTSRQCGALEVCDARLYERPLGLRELRMQAPSFRPPQGFIYLDNHPGVERVLQSLGSIDGGVES